MMEGLCFYFFQIPGNKGFKISCATPNWRKFLFNMSKQLLAPGGLNAECVQVSVM